jgi:ParB family chromosome partitioning protein
MEFKNISLSKIVPSATNPRSKKDLSGPEFNDLADSIKEKGVLVPILVRASAKNYEVIAGMRRFMAASKAGLTEIPAYIAVMNDAEAREAQIIENLQRKDIHPIEEGAAYRELLEQNKTYDIAAVAVHVGKSVSYVRDRLVLTGLIPAVQKEFRDGEISASVASLIARLDIPVQKKALDSGYMRSASTMRDWIQRQIYSDAKNAPWKNDEQMKSMLGGCEECEGKGGDLFGAKAADACTNPKCYAQRMTAYIAIQIQKEPKLRKISDSWGNNRKDSLSHGDYHEINSKKDTCQSAEPAIFTDSEKIGRITKICVDKKCEKHGKSHSAFAETPEDKQKARDERKEQIEITKKLKAKENSDLAEALAKVTFPISEKHLDVLVEFAFNKFGFSYLQPVAKRHDLQPIKETYQSGYESKDYKKPLQKWIKEGGNDRKLQFIFEVLLESYGSFESENRKEALKKL